MEMEEQEKTDKLNRKVASYIDDIPTECPECDAIIEYNGDTVLYCPSCITTWRVEVTKL